MALDGAFLYTVKLELSCLIGGKPDKIYQPSKDEIVISFRVGGGNVRLLMSSSASNARVHITQHIVENPSTPPMFCMLMRKFLSNGRLADIRQDGLERILYFDFNTINEMGDPTKITVACEIMGKHSNIILINEKGKVIDSIKRVDASMSRERVVLPGTEYTYPPKNGDKICLLYSNRDEIKDKFLTSKDVELSKCAMSMLEGISPIFARECAFFAARGREVFKEQVTDEIMDRFLFYLLNIQSNLMSGKNSFNVVLDKNNLFKDFSFVNIQQYGNLMVTKQMPSACETLDYYFSERDSVNRMKQRSYDMLKLLANAQDRISRKLALQKEELKICGERDQIKIKGDLISASIYKLEKGIKIANLENFYSDESEFVEVKMDERLTPAQNAQHYYVEYRKAAVAEAKLTELIKTAELELNYLDSVFDALTRSRSENELLELKYELAEQGYVKNNKIKNKMPKNQPMLEFTSSDGYRILVGKNNKQNDKLTLKTADKSDVWLHTHDIPGSHVIIICNGSDDSREAEFPPETTILEAAVIAAYNSKARESAKVPVDYTFVRYVKKPNGAKPGMVIFTNNKTVFVTPNAELIDKLKS